jgi:hypothetical protein
VKKKKPTLLDEDISIGSDEWNRCIQCYACRDKVLNDVEMLSNADTMPGKMAASNLSLDSRRF